MTDEEVNRIARRIAADPDLKKSLVVNQNSGFLLSDNFKWLVTALAIPAATFLYGLRQAHNADHDRALEARLGDARNNVAAMTALLPSLADSDSRKSRLAYIVLEQLKRAQHTDDPHLTATFDAMVPFLANSPDVSDRVRAADIQETLGAYHNAKPAPALAPTTAIPATTVDSATADKPSLVYIQIFGNAQRDAANSVRSMLRSDGIGAPGIEDVSAKLGGRMHPSPPQIRYFSKGDLGYARWLASHLPEVQGQSWSVVLTQAKGVPSGQLELWWPYPATG